MAVLIYRASDGSILERDFSAELRIGTASENEFQLPGGLTVAPHHAIIARARFFQTPVLVDLAGDVALTRINGRRVVQLKTLHHKDMIEVGQAHLEFWEIMIRKIAPGSPIIGQRCLVCYDVIRPGDEVVACPRCQSPYHKNCWFYLSTCAYYGCGYPIQETLRRVLSPWLRFEKLEEESSLVKERKSCRAGNERDQGTFKPQEYVAYCPDCQTPFHAECWFMLDRCPICQYDVAALLRRVLDPNATDTAAVQEMAAWAKP